MLKIDRERFLTLALGLSLHLSACAGQPPSPTPHQGGEHRQLTKQAPKDDDRGDGHEVTEAPSPSEELEVNPQDEAKSKDEDNGPDDALETIDGAVPMCIEWGADGECTEVEDVFDCVEMGDDGMCLYQHPS